MKEAIGSSGQIARPVRLASEVYELILRRLMSLEIEPGERIGVDALARELEVSQTPIREAMNRLEAHGLVVKVHLAGYRAAPQLTRAQFDDLCELRLLIEPAAAAKAARLLSKSGVAQIRTLADQMTRPLSKDPQIGYNLFAEADARFHGAIAEASRNQLLHGILTQQAVQLRLFRLRLSARATENAIGEHARILAALQDQDPDEAAAAMRSHIEKASARFSEVYSAA